jgi:hypothetical protein
MDMIEMIAISGCIVPGAISIPHKPVKTTRLITRGFNREI